MTGVVSHRAHERFARAARFGARRAVLATLHVAGRPKLSHPRVNGTLIWLVGERAVARACVLSGRHRPTTVVGASQCCCKSLLVQHVHVHAPTRDDAHSGAVYVQWPSR